MTKGSTKSSKIGRDAKTGEFVRLKDGRTIAEPSGGKARKGEISTVVRDVVERRYAASKAS
jgi:hypothetical protein